MSNLDIKVALLKLSFQERRELLNSVEEEARLKEKISDKTENCLLCKEFKHCPSFERRINHYKEKVFHINGIIDKEMEKPFRERDFHLLRFLYRETVSYKFLLAEFKNTFNE